MKHLLISNLLVLVLLSFGCSSSDHDEDAGPKNEFSVGDEIIPINGFQISYSKIKKEDPEATYPVKIHFFKEDPRSFMFEGQELQIYYDSACSILFNINCEEEGLPTPGVYVWNYDGKEKNTCNVSSCYLVNAGHRSVNTSETGGFLIPYYEEMKIYEVTLYIESMERENYTFRFEALDNKSNLITGYFNGGIRYSIIDNTMYLGEVYD